MKSTEEQKSEKNDTSGIELYCIPPIKEYLKKKIIYINNFFSLIDSQTLRFEYNF